MVNWKKLVPKDVSEIILYIAVIVIIIVIVRLFHYNQIERKVKTTSRCLREQTQGELSGKYSVTASNQYNNPMYSVTYDMNAKTYAVDCACTEGNVVNNFQNIDVYDLRDGSNPIKTIGSKICQCDKELTTNTRKYYTGYPGLIRFMNSKDPSFFEKDY